METDDGTLSSIECGFCLLQDAAMKDPRIMQPCGHIHCGTCLSVLWHSMGKMICADCRCESSLDLDGQRYSTSKRHDIWCESCELDSRATIFCTQCQKGFCGSCEKKHRELHSDHETVPTYEYKFKAKSLENRMCTKENHADMELTRSCHCCLSTLCVLCARDLKGQGHEAFIELDSLVEQLKQQTEEIAREMHQKEEDLATLHEQMMDSIREHKAQTERLIYQLNAARVEQLKAINQKYDQLVVDLEEERERSLRELQDFEKTDVTNQWLELIKGRQRVDAYLKYSHKVDLVNEHENRMNEIKDVISKEMPVLNVDIVGTKPTEGLYREPEVELFTNRQTICLHIPYKPEEYVQITDQDSDDDVFVDAASGDST